MRHVPGKNENRKAKDSFWWHFGAYFLIHVVAEIFWEILIEGVYFKELSSFFLLKLVYSILWPLNSTLDTSNRKKINIL